MMTISRRDFFKATAGGILLPFVLEPLNPATEEGLTSISKYAGHMIAGLTDINASMCNLTLSIKNTTRAINNYSCMIVDLYMEPLNVKTNKRKNLIKRIYTNSLQKEEVNVTKQVIIPDEQLRFRVHTHSLSGVPYKVESRLTAIPA